MEAGQASYPLSIKRLIVKGGRSGLRLVNRHENSGDSAPEAVYVDHLILDQDSRLDLAGIKLYFRMLTTAESAHLRNAGPVMDSVGGGKLSGIEAF